MGVTHPDRMGGKGYPRGPTRTAVAVQARIMGIADILEALTARDRPCKNGKIPTNSFRFGHMKLDGHVDPGRFDIFVRERVYVRYAKQFLDPAQIDDVDVKAIPGCTGKGPGQWISSAGESRRTTMLVPKT